MMTIFVMTLGELNYADNFIPWDKLEYPTMANILMVMFVLGMPIILMNMLVSIHLHTEQEIWREFNFKLGQTGARISECSNPCSRLASNSLSLSSILMRSQRV